MFQELHNNPNPTDGPYLTFSRILIKILDEYEESKWKVTEYDQ